MMQQGVSTFIEKRPEAFLRRVRRGIPAEHRWEVWKAAARTEERRCSGLYQKLQTLDNEWKWQIEIDMPRTFPNDPAFDEEYQQSLKRVLHAHANHNSYVGYCQGMNFVAGLLLLVSHGGEFKGPPRPEAEEETFWTFACLMQEGQLSGFYSGGFPLLRRYLWASDQLMADILPDLRDHFAQQNIQPAEYLHQWFLKLFIDCLPLPTVLSFWDAVICGGAVGPTGAGSGKGLEELLSITVSVLKSLQSRLLRKKFEGILTEFKKLRLDASGRIDGETLLAQSSNIRLPPRVIAKLRAPLPKDEMAADAEAQALLSPLAGFSDLGRMWWADTRENLLGFRQALAAPSVVAA
jgi:hypothetical protein